MKLHTIDTGLFKLDGGAMFGVVPKSIWNKMNPADENNLCTWAMRCLLIEDGNKLILIDTGCGNKQSENFFKYYFLHGDQTLEKSLREKGFSREDITDVILTHLHFDHVGGATKWNNDRSKVIPTFANATYWSDRAHWDWATHPNPRESASFLKENFIPIKENGQLRFLDHGKDSPFGSITFHAMKGHTESMLIPSISYQNTRIHYVADLIPSIAHIPFPYVMGYDIRPLDSMVEKEKMLQQTLSNNEILFFEHDPIHECGTVKMTDRGIRIDQTFRLSEL